MNPTQRILTSLLGLAAALPLSATNIHFGPTVPDWDNDYDTADLDFTAGRGTAPAGDPFLWGTGYNDLPNAAYSSVGDSLIFDLLPLGGKEVTLNSFAMGNYLRQGAATGYSIYDLSDLVTPVASAAFNIVYDTTSHPTYAIGLSSTAGFRIVVGPDLWNNGINDIDYSIKDPTITPDAGATAGLLGLSAAALAMLRRKS